MGKNFVDPTVVDGVKRFSGVKKKEQALNTVLHAFVEERVDINSVVTPSSATQEAFLRGVN